VWWCRTPKNSVVYGSGERRIRGQRRIALHCNTPHVQWLEITEQIFT
jgi:hypothetical protein